MMKNILLKYKLLYLVLILLVGCDSILNENPPSSISLASFYQSEGDAVTGIYGAYSNIYGISGNNYLLYGDLIADDLTISPIVSDFYSWDNFTYNSDVTGGLWSNCFSGINRCNEVIAYTDPIDFNAERKAEIISEAKALRAFYYWQLIKTMGGVPLYETQTLGFDNVKAPRSSEEEVYNMIIRDLTEASSVLPETNEAGRFNSYAAEALLARIYLYQKNYSKALESAKIVINSGKYDLLADYANVFKTQYDNSVEHIFQVQFLTGERNSNIPGTFGPRTPAGNYKTAFWSGTVVPGNYAPSAEFVSENPDSYRKTVTLADQFEHINGTETITMEEIYGGIFPYYIRKFDARSSELQADVNFTIIRYADILLIAAEAQNEVDANNNDKYTWINKVRERARNGVDTDLPDLSGLSQDEFRTAVLKERRFELAFEGQRAWDLKRRGQYISKVTAQGKIIQEYMLLFPIPDQQVKLNTNLEQNPGW